MQFGLTGKYVIDNTVKLVILHHLLFIPTIPYNNKTAQCIGNINTYLCM